MLIRLMIAAAFVFAAIGCGGGTTKAKYSDFDTPNTPKATTKK